VLQEAIAELDKRQTAADTEKAKAAVAANAATIFDSTRQVVLGNARATSPWSSSSTTIAASAKAHCPRC